MSHYLPLYGDIVGHVRHVRFGIPELRFVNQAPYGHPAGRAAPPGGGAPGAAPGLRAPGPVDCGPLVQVPRLRAPMAAAPGCGPHGAELPGPLPRGGATGAPGDCGPLPGAGCLSYPGRAPPGVPELPGRAPHTGPTGTGDCGPLVQVPPGLLCPSTGHLTGARGTGGQTGPLSMLRGGGPGR